MVRTPCPWVDALRHSLTSEAESNKPLDAILLVIQCLTAAGLRSGATLLVPFAEGFVFFDAPAKDEFRIPAYGELLLFEVSWVSTIKPTLPGAFGSS
jgi:hypothetical protein